MAAATAREQLLFRWKPTSKRRPSDADIVNALEDVGLVNRFLKNTAASSDYDDLGNDDDLMNLSGAERELLDSARLLLAMRCYATPNTRAPVIALLDEATSALHPRTEKMVYYLLQAECETCISIGHHDTVRKFHDRVVELKDHVIQPGV